MGSPARAVDLAKVLEERGALGREALSACLAELRLGPEDAGDVALAQLLNRRGLVGAAALESALAALSGAAPVACGAVSPPAEAGPRRLGPYLLGRRLGAGAMGAVYEGTHEQTGARHAVKTIFLPPGRSAEDLARFKREAALTSRLSHPNVVRIHAVGLERPPYFIAMDLVEGGTLQARLKREGPLPIAEAVEVAIKLASALAHAHAFGVVHRDMKPLNVLLDPGGEPRLVDFGLARATGESVERLTLSGEVLGTPLYMAPEQVMDARAVDGRADVYGLGAMLFAMLTGQAPIQGTNLTEVLLAVRGNQPPAPSKLRPDVPRELDTICLRALVKDPADRYPSAGDLLQALEAARAALRDAPRRTRRRRSAAGAAERRRRTVAAAGGALLLLVGLVAALAARSPESEPTVSTTITSAPPPRPDPPVVTPAGPARLIFDPGAAAPGGPALRVPDDPFRLLTVALCDDAGRVQASCTLVLREGPPPGMPPTGDEVRLEARVERAAVWSGRAASSPAEAELAGLRVTYSLRQAGGDVFDVRMGDDVAAACLRLAEQGELARAVAALFDAATWEHLLEGVASLDPASAGVVPGSRSDDARGLRWALLGAALQDGPARRRVVVRYDALAAISYDEEVPFDFLKRLGSRRGALLWLLNGRVALADLPKRRALIAPDDVVFDAPADLVEVVVEALPLFASPWGMFVGTLRRGDLVGAHGSEGAWRRLCYEGAPVWVDADALRVVPGADAVVITDPQAWAKVGRERLEGSGIGIAAAGGVYRVFERVQATNGRFHLRITYAGEPCWILELDTRPLRR